MDSVKRLVHRLLVLPLFVALVGCANLGGLEASPRITLAGLRPVDIGLLEQRYAATLRIQNPNREAIAIEGLDFTIEINDRDFASGLSDHDVTVTGFAEQTVEVSALSTLARLFDQLSTMEGSSIRYRLSGRAAIKGIPGTVPFSHEGEIGLDALRPGRKRV